MFKAQAPEVAPPPPPRKLTGPEIRQLYVNWTLAQFKRRRGQLGGRREYRSLAEASYTYYTPGEYAVHCLERGPKSLRYGRQARKRLRRAAWRKIARRIASKIVRVP